MFNSVYLYIILGLAASTASLGWLSVHNYRAKVEAESALVVAINVNIDMQKSLNLKDLSCKQDDKDTTEIEADKAILKDKVDSLSAQMNKLKSGIKKPVSQNINNPEAPKNAEANTILDGTELLSDDLKRLLTESYCLVEDCVGVPTGQLVK